ncbi:MAG: type II secretion system F family protein [Actinobacteria bacterium]|nr:type II secretion system F family protein [Actinomycetota bacterium]
MTRRRRLRALIVRRAAAVLAGAAAIVVGLPGGSAAAPGEPSSRVEIVAVDSSAHPEVTLSVQPPAELAGSALSADAFSLTENGTAVDVVVEQAGAKQSSLDVVLVIDTSGSMKGAPLEAARSAASAFLDQMPDGARVAVVTFGDTPTVSSVLSLDRAGAVQAIAGLEASGETALYDALNVGAAQLAAVPGREAGPHRALVVLSDGGDTASAATLEATAAVLKEAGFEFTAVEFVTPEYDGTALHSLADTAGGRVLSTDDPAQLAAVYGDVAADLLNRYAVTYTSRAGGETQVALSVRSGDVASTTSRSIRLPALDGIAVTAPDVTVNPEPGWFAQAQALWAGIALLFVMFAALLAWAFLSPREARVSLAGALGSRARRVRLPAVSDWAERMVRVADRGLEQAGRDSALYAALEQAGVNLRPGEFVVLLLVAAFAVFAAALALAGIIAGVVSAAVALAAGPTVVRVLARKRRNRFGEQLADTLQLITGNLRAGHSVLQAIDSVAADAPSPTKEEFERLVVEVRLGRDLPDALRAMHERIGNQDFEWFVQALQIHREIGGDLAEILDTVGETVRERGRLRRHVKALSAEGRLSAIILYVLPFAIAALISVLNPDYMAELFGTGMGKALLVLVAGLMTAGFFWLRRVIRLEF